MVAHRSAPMVVLLMLALAATAWAQAPDGSAAAGSPSSSRLDWIEKQVVQLEQSVIEASRDMGAALEAERSSRGPQVTLARTWLDSLLAADSTQVRANILYARLGRAIVLCTPIVYHGGDESSEALPIAASSLIRALDRALRSEPNNAEAHYWKGVICTSSIEPSGPMARSAPDLEAGMRSLQRAVELAPADTLYKSILAMVLVMSDRQSEALPLYRDVEGTAGRHFRLLRDMSLVPVPPGAVYAKTYTEMARTAVEMPDAPFRMSTYFLPGDATAIEAFYRQRWPGFQWMDVQALKFKGRTNRVHVQYVFWRADSLALDPLARTAEDVQRLGDSFLLKVEEMRTRDAEVLALLPARVEGGSPFCMITLLNRRDLPKDGGQ